MHLRSLFPNQTIPRIAALFTLCLLLPFSGPAIAQSLYLTPGSPDGIALLPPPPVPGSPEETADLQIARAVFLGRTPVDEQRATKSSSLSFSLFSQAIGPSFDLARLPKADSLLQKVKKEIGRTIDIPKEHFKRLRPYQMDERLSLGKSEASASYPSGHSTRGTVYALLLAELFPEHKNAIQEVGRDIGWDRVIIGKHFPTDVYAGRVLGQAIFRELVASPSFQRDLAEAKAEIRAAQLQAR